jgi:hypothetical protein
MAGFVAAAPGTAKAGKPHRDLTEKRRNRVFSVVLHMANSTTASAIRPANGVASGLCGNDFLLEACQQQLSVGYGQTEIGDMAEIIRSVDLHDVDVSSDIRNPAVGDIENPATSVMLMSRSKPLRL